jgi:DNA-binding LacI/PurR family transcriptional regulator
MTQYLTPSLTSVRQPIWEVGQQVVSILLSCLDEEDCQNQHLLLTPQLVIRQSSDPAAVA